MGTLRVQIVNPEKKVFDGEAGMVIVRTVTGEMGVLPGHAPLIAVLDARPVRILKDEGEVQVDVQGGIIQVRPEGVTILTPG